MKQVKTIMTNKKAIIRFVFQVTGSILSMWAMLFIFALVVDNSDGGPKSIPEFNFYPESQISRFWKEFQSPSSWIVPIVMMSMFWLIFDVWNPRNKSQNDSIMNGFQNKP
jgi:glycerol uptake facilitator-like aquaporin